MTKRKIEYWVIPPEQDGEFVACMEEVLDTYARKALAASGRRESLLRELRCDLGSGVVG